MAGKTRTPARPAWYSPDAYLAAEELDAGDWLLNLVLRSWLHREWREQTEEALQSAGPVLRRNDEAQIIRMHRADTHRWVAWFRSSDWDDPFIAFKEARTRPSLPGDVWHALQTGKVKAGITPLSVSELYTFEKRLSEEVRAEGARFQQRDDFAGLHASPTFRGKLDDAYSPQMVSRFVRINLALPDDVLRADLEAFLASERQRLEKLGGQQPYRESARLKLKAHDLNTLAKVGLLQFLDLYRWQARQGLGLSFYAVREIAGIADRSREAELRHRVALTLQQFQLHAWFARLERGGSRKRSHRS